MFTGLFFVLFGLLGWIAVITATLSWWGLCFGTVLIGLVLFFFAPHVLVLPLIPAPFFTRLIMEGLSRLDRGRTIDCKLNSEVKQRTIPQASNVEVTLPVTDNLVNSADVGETEKSTNNIKSNSKPKKYRTMLFVVTVGLALLIVAIIDSELPEKKTKMANNSSRQVKKEFSRKYQEQYLDDWVTEVLENGHTITFAYGNKDNYIALLTNKRYVKFQLRNDSCAKSLGPVSIPVESQMYEFDHECTPYGQRWVTNDKNVIGRFLKQKSVLLSLHNGEHVLFSAMGFSQAYKKLAP